MKICDLVDDYYENKSGGIGTYIGEKVKFIDRNTTHEHLLICAGEKDDVKKEGRLTVYTISSPMYPGSDDERMLYKIGKVVEILCKENPDIIEVSRPYVLQNAAFNFDKKQDVPLVGFYHSDIPNSQVLNSLLKVFGEKIASYLRNHVKRELTDVYNSFDSTIVASQDTRKRIESYGITNSELINLGVDLETFTPKKRDLRLRRELGVKDNEKLLVYTGRFDKIKNLELLVKAMEYLPQKMRVKLLFVGDGSEKKKLEKMAKDDERIMFYPYLKEKSEIARILASSDVYLTACPYETFGLSVLEAEACGLPVVGINSGAVIERVPKEVGFLGEVDNPLAFAKNIRRVIGKGTKKMGLNARRFAEGYSWENTFTKMLGLYERLIEDHKQKAELERIVEETKQKAEADKKEREKEEKEEKARQKQEKDLKAKEKKAKEKKTKTESLNDSTAPLSERT